jgi:hypothetical protein
MCVVSAITCSVLTETITDMFSIPLGFGNPHTLIGVKITLVRVENSLECV